MISGRSVSQYLKLLQSLLPRGMAWSRGNSSTLGQFLSAIAEELVRLELAALSLLEERDTQYTSTLLEDHEYDLGLPDECSTLGETLVQRRKQAHAKLIALGGAHKQYFVDLAASLGYTITIQEYPEAGLASIFHWQVSINYDDDVYLIWFTSNGSVSGDPISQIVGSDMLECFLARYKPAHTRVFFGILGPAFGQDFDLSFNSLPSESGTTGSFDRAFNVSFDVYYGGGFEFTAFGIGFNKQA